MTGLDNELQRHEIQGSGWNLQGNNYLKKITLKLMLWTVGHMLNFQKELTQS